VNLSDSTQKILCSNYLLEPGSPPHAKLRRLLVKCRDSSDFHKLASPFLTDLPDFNSTEVKQWVKKETEICQRLQLEIIDYFMDTYPANLRQIPDPPLVLYVRGNTALLKEQKLISLVGARRCTAYGRQSAQTITRALAQSGYITVSGMAMGIDGEVHNASLLENSGTIAVLGSGVNLPTPDTNKDLYQRILEGNGAIISEFPLNTHSFPSHFPFRNRIIAGLSTSTIVVQAQKRSGSLITARLALEYGRDVLAVPGDIHAPSNQGNNHLILDGAFPVISTESLLDFIEKGKKIRKPIDITSKTDKMTCREREVFTCLCEEILSINELADRTTMSISELNVVVSSLESRELIRQTTDRKLMVV
jgi:DNA processing protein